MALFLPQSYIRLNLFGSEEVRLSILYVGAPPFGARSNCMSSRSSSSMSQAPTPETHPCRVRDVRRLTQDSVLITLDPEAALAQFEHKPGQRVTFCLDLQDRTCFRSYNLVNQSGALPQVAVKKVTRGGVAEHFNDMLRIGDVLNVMPPEGTLYPDSIDQKARHLILFAAGSGITPIYSIARHALRARPDHHVTLFYANSSTRDIMFAQELEELAHSSRMEVFHILGDGGTGEDVSSGRVNGRRVSKLMEQYGGIDLPEHAFISGPPGFMNAVESGLIGTAKPIPYNRYSFANQPYLHPKDVGEDQLTSQLHIHSEGECRVLKDAPRHLTILEAADQAGLDMPADCRSGICHRCKAKLVQGRTVSKPDKASSNRLKKGWILCCQERPASPEIGVEFP